MLKYLLLLGVLILAGCSGDDDDGIVVTTFRMEGASMEPTLFNGDEVDVLQFDRPAEDGDIIVFAAPTSIERQFAKRVIAVPGQTVLFGGEHHWLNRGRLA